jgi:hypothetical protein
LDGSLSHSILVVGVQATFPLFVSGADTDGDRTESDSDSRTMSSNNVVLDPIVVQNVIIAICSSGQYIII